MIGVIADPSERDVVCEFFELFKTPWEFYREDARYDVLLCVGDRAFEEDGKLVVVYAGTKTSFDDRHRIQTGEQRKGTGLLLYQGHQIPIYGDSVTFPEKANSVLADQSTQECVAWLDRAEERALARVGYDLFSEVRSLLTEGQPLANAHIPTLEMHIAFLRDLITGCGIRFIEIPPVPQGYRFIACLTHDVDHPSIRRHRWDHTTFGFVHRALFGSLGKFVRRRMSIRGVFRNWAAALKLPFVHLGLAKDFWQEFGERYLELEKGLPSTFFVIPFQNLAGKTLQGQAPSFRAARYGACDIAHSIERLTASGCEVGLHGIDAWLNSADGRKELEEIRRLTGVPEIGVRMHWLYFDQRSPSLLEEAGAGYDSTIGYNETVGYRAGTGQVFKPLGVRRLLELPLHVMDTALFYPAHRGLSPRQAGELLTQFVDLAVQFGGCLTINWHDRSLMPERMWETSYRDLIQELKSRGAWFATAKQAVAWFQKRRSAVFETDGAESCDLLAGVVTERGNYLPDLRLRIYNGRESPANDRCGSGTYIDLAGPEAVRESASCNSSA
jgi:peptidoglycan/xylan/chitin deacetylase (PgdA/CDA1 family)